MISCNAKYYMASKHWHSPFKMAKFYVQCIVIEGCKWRRLCLDDDTIPHTIEREKTFRARKEVSWGLGSTNDVKDSRLSIYK